MQKYYITATRLSQTSRLLQSIAFSHNTKQVLNYPAAEIKKAGLPALPAIVRLFYVCYLTNFRLRLPSPISPTPIRTSVAGSGTGAGATAFTNTTRSL